MIRRLSIRQAVCMVTIALLRQACVTITRPETGTPLHVNDGFGIDVGRI